MIQVVAASSKGLIRPTTSVSEAEQGGVAKTVQARLLVLGGTGIAARVATGSDASALGLELKGLSMGMALATPTDSSDGRSWLTLSAQANSLTALGTEAMGLSLTGRNLSLKINTGLGQTEEGLANTSVVDWSKTPLVIKPTDNASALSLNMKGRMFEVGGTMDVQLGDLLTASRRSRSRRRAAMWRWLASSWGPRASRPGCKGLTCKTRAWPWPCCGQPIRRRAIRAAGWRSRPAWNR
jgi:hypothetical protein